MKKCFSVKINEKKIKSRFHPKQGRPGKLKEELEKVKKEVVELNETLSSEFQLYQQFKNELAKIEDGESRASSNRGALVSL
jgi:predicted  nucleic acid-binding Zn-ribbon protein